ncbi:hypothetical protein NDU88_001844, partial [Pleurodeles waltl]
MFAPAVPLDFRQCAKGKRDYALPPSDRDGSLSTSRVLHRPQSLASSHEILCVPISYRRSGSPPQSAPPQASDLRSLAVETPRETDP